MISALITLIVYIIVLAILWWLANYVLDNFPLPEPANKLVRVAIVIAVVLIALYLLLGIFGIGGVESVPRLRGFWQTDDEMINWLGLHREYLQLGEMEILVEMLREIKAQTVVEIGCRDGRTAKVLLHNVPTIERYVGVDVPQSYIPKLTHQLKEMVQEPGCLASDDPRFELCTRQHGSLDLRPDDLPLCDAVFIDGDHSEEAVEHDSELAASSVRRGGLVIWHDASNDAVEVKSVLDRLRARGWSIKLVPRTWLAVMTTWWRESEMRKTLK
jgi:predicted O-methyltransferase YrrM